MNQDFLRGAKIIVRKVALWGKLNVRDKPGLEGKKIFGGYTTVERDSPKYHIPEFIVYSELS